MAKLSVEQALARAKSHKKRGEVAEAKTLYATILKAFPNNKKAQKGLTALGDARPLNAKQSPPETTINDLANLFNKGQLDAVVQQCEILVRHYSNSFLVWSFMGGLIWDLVKLQKPSMHSFE